MRTRDLSLLLLLLITALAAACKKEQVGPPAKMAMEAVVTNASAFNAGDGAVTVNISGITGDIQYYWSNGATTKDIAGLYAGEYTLEVTFGKSGYSTLTATVSQPDPDPLLLSFEVTGVSRFGKSDGSILLTVNGGSGPYLAIWDFGDTTLNPVGLSAGTYRVSVTDNSAPFQIPGEGAVEVTQPDFICGTDSIADGDGNLYPTVLIGGQCWMAENLKTEYLPADPASPIEGRFCFSNFCYNKEGAHYTWEAAMNGETADPEDPYTMVQGLCPDGWFLPSRKMFQDLDSILSIDGNYGSGTFSGTKMKEENSSSGFNALFAGNWGYGVYLNDEIASFWTSTEYFTGDSDISEEGYYFLLTDDTPFLSSGHKLKEYGMNIRCVRPLE